MGASCSYANTVMVEKGKPLIPSRQKAGFLGKVFWRKIFLGVFRKQPALFGVLAY
jgi:hypothetical protein